MSIEVLNTELVASKMKDLGWNRAYVIGKLGLKQEGYRLLRGEWLPKDRARKTLILKKLAHLLGVEERDILVRLQAAKTA